MNGLELKLTDYADKKYEKIAEMTYRSEEGKVYIMEYPNKEEVSPTEITVVSMRQDAFYKFCTLFLTVGGYEVVKAKR